jgi:hypothetical protein
MSGDALQVRRANAARLHEIARESPRVATIGYPADAAPGFLRFPVVSSETPLPPAKSIGAVPGYPRLLDEEPAISAIVDAGSERLTGAAVLRDRLRTLPVHGMMQPRDFDAIRRWLLGS